MAMLAGCQQGLVARWQLLEFGFKDGAIDHRLACGRLHLIHKGVYAVGHRKLSRLGRWMAAVLACGRGAVLSHSSAAALWGIRDSASSRIHVTVPGAPRRHTGINAHRSKLPADEVTILEGIPVTSVSRTLLDLAAGVTPSQLDSAIREADALRLFDENSLEDLLKRYPRRRGAATARKALEEVRLGVGRTREELEARFKELLFAATLPRPEFNATLELNGTTIHPDCLWPKQRLIVELDSHTFHGTRAAFEADRERDRKLAVAGFRVIRVTWRHTERPEALLADLRRLCAE
jgi:predicted transcriptional regulator of viral defense system